MKKIRHNGFTLTEIMVTIIILASMLALALPQFTGYGERVRSGEGIQILAALLNGQKLYQVENNQAYATAEGDLDVTIPASANFIVLNVGDNPPTSVAEVRRLDGTDTLYELRIDDAGDICCTNGVGSICAEIGVTGC